MKNIKRFNFDLKTLQEAINSPRGAVPVLESYSDLKIG